MEHKDGLGSRLQIRKIMGRLQFPTLFSRLVTVYISIIIITLIILFVAFTNAFQSYFVEYTQEIMIKQAQSITEEYYKVGRYNDSREEALEKILYRIQVMNSYLQATAWLVDRSGNISTISANNNEKLVEVTLPQVRDINKVFEGNIVRIENGFTEYFSTPVLTIGYPMENEKRIEYALFIHTPMPIILQTIDEVRNIILQVVGIIGTFVFAWIYIISKQMTRPLKEMNSVAKTIASGQFDKRIEVAGQDEIAQLGASLNNMADELDKIEENRRSFIANVSHDLRSPLTSIQGFITAILDGTIPFDKQERYLNVVLGETKRMISMTNTILELNTMEESKAPIKKVVFNINKMIEHIALSLETRAKEKSVTIQTYLDSQYIYALGEIDGINRVIQNLLDNAFKFVNEGGNIKIITTYRQNKIWVSVCNSGPPIPKEQQKHIWERFYKGDSSRGEDRQGVGLGLVIVKEILKKHEEIAGVDSEEGEMVVFYFSISTPKNT